MGASNPKAQTQQAQANPAAITKAINLNSQAQTIVQNKNNEQAFGGPQGANKSDFETINKNGPEQNRKDLISPLRNMFKKRIEESHYEDWIAKVDVNQKAEKKQVQPIDGTLMAQTGANQPFQKGFPQKLENKQMNKSDGIKPIDFKQPPIKKGLAANQQGHMGETLRKKMQQVLNKRLERGTERMRARTPNTITKELFKDVLEGPILLDYLKSQHFFKDEMDEEPEDQNQYFGELKYANDLVSPMKWDSNTVVLDVFRVLQDLTPYVTEFEGAGEIGGFGEIVINNPNQQNDPFAENYEMHGGINELIGSPTNNKYLGTLSGQGGKELYNTQLLYDKNLNRNLMEPGIQQPAKQGKAIMTLRVELKKSMCTSILKVPSGHHFDKESFMNQMQLWSSIPYHKRIVRPLCFASLNQEIPLVFVEDIPFCLSLEDVVLDRSFYRGNRYRLEISQKILSCVIQVIENLDHAHKSGVMHLNLHAGNILVPKCATREQQIGYFLTDFGDPLLLMERSQWNEVLEKTYQRMMRYYPPNVLSLIKLAAQAQSIQQRREALRKLKLSQNILIDIFSVGILILFLVCGGYEWSNTLELRSIFDQKMIKAESLIDLYSLRALKNTMIKCLFLNKNEEPVDRIAELLPQLKHAKVYCEKVLQANSIPFFTNDKLFKSFYEYLPGQKKEQLFNQDLEIYISSKDLTKFEKDIQTEKIKQIQGVALNPIDSNTKTQPLHRVRSILKKEKDQKFPPICDEDVESNILNNQAVLAYQKQNYRGCVELLIKLQESFQASNPYSQFNNLILGWEAGLYSDEYVVNEIGKIAVNPYNGRVYSSLMLGLFYEAQNNWLAAKVNYGLAIQSASDGLITQMKYRFDNCKQYAEKYPEQFLYGHLEQSDIQDIVLSYNGRYAATFQKTSRIIIWGNLINQQKILKEIEDKNATCMDANAKLDRIVVGLRSGLIVMFNLAFEQDQVVNVDEVELGFHTSMILVIKLSKDGVFGLSGGLDQYIALWNCQKKVLLSKIDISGKFLKSACINMNGEDFMFSTSGSFDVEVYHHSLGRKQILPVQTLSRHKAQVTAVDISYDGLLGVTGGQDRMIYLWDIQRGEVLREISTSSFILKTNLSAMGKYLAVTLLDGTVMLYETLTGIIWRSEKLDGKHSGVSLVNTNYIMEMVKEGQEHKMMLFMAKHNDRLQREFAEARGLGQATYQSMSPNQTRQSDQSPKKTAKLATQPVMDIVPEVDPEEESDYKRGTMRTTNRTDMQNQQTIRSAKNNEELVGLDHMDIHDVNPEEEVMLQDLFFENPVFKFFYFQDDEFTKRMSYDDFQSELNMIGFDRAKDPYAKNHFLLRSSLEQFEGTTGISQFERGQINYQILQERRKKFDLNSFRTPKQVEVLKEMQEMNRLLLLVGETRRGEESDITNQGNIVGVRFQQITLPLIGRGPSLMITHADQTKNIQFKISLKAKSLREQGIEAFISNNNEQSKYYLQQMKDLQTLIMNPSAIQVWGALQMESYKKGRIQNVFKIRGVEIVDKHYGPVEHIKFCKNERYAAIMTKDFMISFWEVGSWTLKQSFRAYHDSHAKFYLKQVNLDLVCEEFDVGVMTFNNSCNLLVCGLFSGVIQFWDITNTELILEIPSHLSEVTALIFNNDQTILVSAGADYLINVWNANNQQLLFEIREHLGPITHLSIVEDQNENDQLIEQIVSIDIEGYMIFVSLDGYIERKFSVERSSNHIAESMDVLFSAYEIEREMFLVRRNLNTTFFEFQKAKAGVEGYYAAYDTNSFPTIMKDKVDKRKPIDFIQVNQRGEFVCLAQKRDSQIQFRNSATLVLEKRIELKDQIHYLACGSLNPYMFVYTEKGLTLWMIEWDIA